MNYMKVTKERKHKLRTLSPLIKAKVFKFTNQSEAREPLERKIVSSVEEFKNIRRTRSKDKNSKRFIPAYHGKYLNDSSLYLNSFNSFESFQQIYKRR